MQVLDDVVPAGAGEADAMQNGGHALDSQQLLYCERAVEMLIDLLSQLPTRRFVRTLLDDRAVLLKCRMAPLFSHPDGEKPHSFSALLRMFIGAAPCAHDAAKLMSPQHCLLGLAPLADQVGLWHEHVRTDEGLRKKGYVILVLLQAAYSGSWWTSSNSTSSSPSTTTLATPSQTQPRCSCHATSCGLRCWHWHGILCVGCTAALHLFS